MSDILDTPYLACPTCETNLEIDQSHATCHQCNNIWPVKNSIPRFSNSNSYWGEIPESLMDKILHHARENGWREALGHYLRHEFTQLREYILDETRADWRFLLPLDSTTQVLDVGAGWGLISSVLSQICGTVFSLEKIQKRVDFLQIRVEQEKLYNLQIIQSDFLDLPFSENSLDCVICNGVLEWIGLSENRSSPKDLQTKFLNKIWKILRPGGYVYVGIENRFGYRQLLGEVDHSGLRFTSLMPRFIADLGVRAVRYNKAFHLDENVPRGYRTYTYTASGYKKLLKRCSFEPQLYYAIASYNYPKWLVPAENPKALRFMFRSLFFPRTQVGRIMKRMVDWRLPGYPQRFFMSDFCIIGRKAST